MTGKQLKMEEKEFEDKCLLTEQIMKDKKIKENIRSINDDDDTNSDEDSTN